MGLWAYIYIEHTPRFSQTIRASIKYTNKSRALHLKSGPRTIEIKLKGNPEDFKTIDPKKIWAEVDLSKVKAGKHSVPITVHKDTKAKLAHKNLAVTVVLQKLNSIERPLEVVPTGSLSIEKSLGQIKPSHKVITLYGFESELNRVEKAAVTLYLADQKKTFAVKLPVEPRDTFGNIVENVHAEPEQVRLRVEVNNANTRIVPVTLNDTGAAAGDLVLDYSPQSVTLFGKDEFLNRVSSISTEAFSRKQCKPGESFEVKLIFPHSVFSFEDEVSVTCAKPEIVTRAFTVNIETVNVPKGLKARLKKDKLEVTIKGESSFLNQLKLDQIKVRVDLSKFTKPGEYEVRPEVIVPEHERGLDISYDQKPVKVNIVDK